VSGYTPLFSSLTTGTLCGRWPDIGLWPIILSMADKNGVVDVTTQYISSVTGLEHGQVVECMNRFCQPDPGSRTNDLDGARLALVDPSRSWGWRIVNHGKYKEKARLMAKSAREVATGQNRGRMGHRRGPPETADDPLSNANANANKEKKKSRQEALANARATPGLNLEAWDRWLAYRSERKPAIQACSAKEAAEELAGFGADQMAVVKQSIAKQWQGLFALKVNGHGRPVQEAAPQRASRFPS
jgi:hypothetical protein